MHLTLGLLIGFVVGFVVCWFLRNGAINLLKKERDQLKAATIKTVSKI